MSEACVFVIANMEPVQSFEFASNQTDLDICRQ